MNKARITLAALGITAFAGIAAPIIIPHEGMVNVGYNDHLGIPTACAGHTATAVVGKRYSPQECEALLAQDIEQVAYAPMKRNITAPLSKDEAAAIGSLAFNIPAAVGRSTLVRELNAGRYRQACNQILQWRNAGGVDCSKNGSGCAGIWERRMKERDICLYGRDVVAAREALP